MNKTVFIVAGLAAFGAIGCAVAGPEREEVRDMAPFSEVVLLGDYAFEVRAGGPQMVALRGAEEDLAVIETEVRDGVLTVRKRRGSEPRRVDVTVDLPVLRLLAAHGAADGRLSGVSDTDLELSFAGAVSVVAAGSCRDATLDMSGSVTFDAEMLVCETMDIDIAGSGVAAVHTTDAVTLDISGAGRVDVYGNPERVIPGRLAGAVAIDVK